MVFSESRSTLHVQAANSKLALSLSKNGVSEGVRVVHLQPSIDQVGSSLQEAKNLRHQHDQLIIAFNTKRREHGSEEKGEGGGEGVVERGGWSEVFSFLEARKGLLDQSVSFYTASQQLLKKLSQVEAKISESASVSGDADGAKKDLEKHESIKKSILEASMTTLQEGQWLLERVRKVMREWGAVGGQCHATTSSCFPIEQLLLNLTFKKISLQELWSRRKTQLQQCVNLMLLKEEVTQLLKWLDERSEEKEAEGGGDENVLLQQNFRVQEQFCPLPQRIKHFLSRLDMISTECLKTEVSSVKDSLLTAETKVDSRITQLEARQRSLQLHTSFQNNSSQALRKLESLAGMADCVGNNEEAFDSLCGSVYDASVAALREGELLQRGAGADDDAIKTVVSKMKVIEDRVVLLMSRPPPLLQNNMSIQPLKLKLHKLSSWLQLIGQPGLQQHQQLPCKLSAANHFLLSHRSLCEEVKTKHSEVSELLKSLEGLMVENKKTTEKEAAHKTAEEEVKKVEMKTSRENVGVLKERCEKVLKEYEHLQGQLEQRGTLALSFIILLKRQRQLSSQTEVWEDEMSRCHGDHVTQECVSFKHTSISKLCIEIDDFIKSSKTLQEEVEKSSKTDSLLTQGMVRWMEGVERGLESSKRSLQTHLKEWENHATACQQDSSQASQLLTNVRKTIEWIGREEENFYPKIAGELGSSLQEVQANQKKLQDFFSVAKKAQDETEGHLKSSEVLHSGPEKDLVLKQLLSTQARFQARLSEHQHLLNISATFFQHLAQLDAVIEVTEKTYKVGEMAGGVGEAKKAVELHEEERGRLRSMIEGACREGDGIVVRVRQEDAQEHAKDEVRRSLQEAEALRRGWNEEWQQQHDKLQDALVLCRFFFDLKQLQNELDMLQRQLEARQGKYGTSAASVQAFIQAFQQLQDMSKEVGGRVDTFGMTAERMIMDGHYDSRKIRHELEETQKRWKKWLDSLGNVRLDVDEALKFFTVHSQCEEWISVAGAMLLGVKKRAGDCKGVDEVEGLVREVEEFQKVGGGGQDSRLKDMEVISTALYGPMKGPGRMQGVLEQTQATYNSFIKTIEELRGLKWNLANTENILAKVEKVVESGDAKKTTTFTSPLLNATINEGHCFTWECRLQCDTGAPLIEWFKDGEATKGWVPNYNKGACSLNIQESMLTDSGTYTCKVTSNGESATTSASLQVKAAVGREEGPELLKHLRGAEVPEGTSHTFECCVVGTPTPTTQWFLNDLELTNNNDYVMTNDQGRCSLKVKRLNREKHNGKIKFKATNSQGEVATSAALHVFVVKKPEFLTALKNSEVEEGASVRLHCMYTGQPAPQIQWFFNDSTLLPSALFKIAVGDDDTSLEIKEVYAEDCGTYSVSARNLAGEVRTSCLIALGTRQSMAKQHQSREMEKTRFVGQLSDQGCKEGSKVTFECYVAGHPTPEISWFHNGKAIKQTNDFHFTFDKFSGRCSLTIEETYVEDSGAYVCQARNQAGSDATTGRLSVEALPEQSDFSSHAGEVPPKFTQLLRDIEATEGELVRFECRIIGTPTPLIKWFQGRNAIENGPEFQMSSDKELQTLTIHHLHRHDTGNYMLRATNNAGIAKCYATLLVKQRSDRHAMKVRLVESSHSVQTDQPLQSGHVAPEIVKSFHDVHVRPGQACTIQVVITGTPKPEIEWLFNNEPVKTFKTSSLGDVHCLHIPCVREEDVGRFSVIAHNAAGKAWCSALLVVVDCSQLLAETDSPPETPQVSQTTVQRRKYIPIQAPPSDLPPKFFAELTPITSLPGRRVVLEVLVEGRPEPLITWYKDGVDLTADPSYEISCRDGRARLVILQAAEGHSGSYSCVARNHLGSSRSSATVTVEAAGVPPRIVQGMPTNTRAHVGERVKLVVISSGKPVPKAVWLRDGVELKHSTDFIITSETHTHSLLLPRVYVEDSGRFDVRLENLAGQASSHTILKVQPLKEEPKEAPKFTKALHNMSVKVDQKAILECNVPANTPVESVQWIHNNHPLQPTPNHQMSYQPQFGLCQLVLLRVSPQCRGRYVCTVVLNGLSNSTAMHLDVAQQQAPVLTQQLRNQVTDEGSQVLFSCQIQGQPTPTVKWLHNGQVLSPSSKHANQQQSNNGECTLLIPCTTHEDQGIYTCVASNPLGEQYSSAELKVRSKTPLPTHTHHAEVVKDRGVGGVSELYMKPVFKRIPADLSVPEGHVARFDCLVIGRPSPDVYWFREGVRVAEDWMHKVVINEEGINSLIFEAVHAPDAGNYLCIARNRAGEDRYHVALNVLSRSAPNPPRFSHRIGDQTVREGQAVSFTVEAEGIPQPQLTWLKNQQAIHQDNHYRITGDAYKTTLHIPTVTSYDDATYACVARSSTGTTSNTFRIIVHHADDDVSNVRLANHRAPSPTSHHNIRLTHSPVPQTIRLSPNPYSSPTPYASPNSSTITTNRRVSQTTMKTVHTGTLKSTDDSVAAPELQEAMKDQLVPVGGRAHFRCRITSPQQPPTHQWFFAEAPLGRGLAKIRTYEERDGLYGLEMDDVREEDAGIYKVTVENQGGEVTCIAHLKVGVQPSSGSSTRVRATPSPVPFMQPPHILTPLPDHHVTLGSSANFEVAFQGPPLQKVEWMVNGEVVHDGQDDGNIILHQNGNRSSMFISNVQPSLCGRISCTGINENGKVESTSTLSIKGLNSPRGSINLSSQQQYQHLQHQQHLGIPQQISAHQHQQIHSSQQQQYQQQIHSPQHQHHQHIHSPQQQQQHHQGVARFIKGLEDVGAKDGSEVVLSCSFVGESPMHVSWSHNGVCIDQSQDFAISVDKTQGLTELVIVDCMQDDNGEFACNVSNTHGHAQTTCHLNVTKPHSFETSFDTSHIHSSIPRK